MHLEESASDGGGCRRRAPRWEGVEQEERVADSLSLSLFLTRRRRMSTKRRDGDGRNTCSGRVHAFQGFRESGEYDGGDVSLNIWRGRDFKRTRVTVLGRRLNNAKSTYSSAVPSRAVSLSFFSFLSRLSMSFNLLSFPIPIPFPSPSSFSFSRSHHFCRNRPFSLQPARIPPFQSASFFPLLSRFLHPFLYSVTYRVSVLYFISYI